MMDETDESKRARFAVLVHVALLKSGEVFLLKRQNTGVMDGSYCFPGGHMEHGESLKEAALRECREEVGVQPSNLDPISIFSYRDGGNQGVNFVFLAECWSGRPLVSEPENFSGGDFFSLKALPEPIPEWVRDTVKSFEGGKRGISLIEKVPEELMDS